MSSPTTSTRNTGITPGANIHGSGFGFLRNTALDARNFFSPERGFFRQNQFGGTLGGAFVKEKLFYFGDYQGTRTNQGIDTGLIPVPTLANRTGDLSDHSLTGKVAGPFGQFALSKARLWCQDGRTIGDSVFSTSTQGRKLRDDKGSFRLDGNSSRWGFLSGYYFFDEIEQSVPEWTRRRDSPGFCGPKLR